MCDLSEWLGDRRTGWCQRNYMQSVCCWALQQPIDLGVRGVLGRMGDERTVVDQRHAMHGVLGRAVQLCVDGGVRTVQSWPVPDSGSSHRVLCVSSRLNHRHFAV
jgi:hypothetical protein